jgi:hypothetical protein
MGWDRPMSLSEQIELQLMLNAQGKEFGEGVYTQEVQWKWASNMPDA